jgi:hypothetical protein
MHTSNRCDVRELNCHFKSIPDSPAKANYKKTLVTLIFKVVDNTSKSGFYSFIILIFYACDNLRHVHLAVVGFNQELRKVNIVSERCPSVGEGFVLAAGGAKDV